MHDRIPPRWRTRWAAASGLTPVVAKRLVPPAETEQPGPDGIRWGLVARVRAEIAAGVYDTAEKWAAAEDRLLRRVEEEVQDRI